MFHKWDKVRVIGKPWLVGIVRSDTEEMRAFPNNHIYVYFFDHGVCYKANEIELFDWKI